MGVESLCSFYLKAFSRDEKVIWWWQFKQDEAIFPLLSVI
jgi:hypothetical protein